MQLTLQDSNIETPVIDQQIFEVLEEPFAWYEEPMFTEKLTHYSPDAGTQGLWPSQGDYRQWM